jgi:hypothetical protein
MIQSLSRTSIAKLACAAAAALVMLGCTPRYDWREVRGTDDSYSILLPAKPAALTRTINLDGVRVAMTMTAAEVDGVTFAVGSAQLPDAPAAQAALDKMKVALVKNINGGIKHEKRPTPGERMPTIELEARGDRNGRPLLLLARFVAKDRRAYQVVVAGPEKAVVREAAETFLTSLNLR